MVARPTMVSVTWPPVARLTATGLWQWRGLADREALLESRQMAVEVSPKSCLNYVILC
jgi:hypothetical protein